MPFYEYTCSSGQRWDVMRPVADRDLPIRCSAGGEGKRVYSVPVIHWPRSLWTQWGDIHNRSAREMARDPSVERYDPAGPVAPQKQDARPELKRAFNEALAQHGRPEGMA